MLTQGHAKGNHGTKHLKKKFLQGTQVFLLAAMWDRLESIQLLPWALWL